MGFFGRGFPMACSESLERNVMKTSLKVLLAAGVLCAAGATASVPASAAGLSFRVGDVAMGYNDGYYDRSHSWHAWRNASEHRYYRSHYATNYRGMRHDRDHDGVPDRVDSRPNNPYRN
jgi:hypothetical protein